MSVQIAELSYAPGKSMRPQEHIPELRFDSKGMFDDRILMWIEAEPHTNTTYHPGETALPGQFLSQREDPVLATIIPEHDPFSFYLKSDVSGDSILSPFEFESDAKLIPVSIRGWQGVAVDH